MAAAPESWIISTVGTHLLLWARRAGFDVEAALAEGGLSRELFEEPPRRIPVTAMATLWRVLAARSDDPAFALRSGASAIRGLVPVLGHYMGASRSIRDAFGAYMKHSALFSNTLTGHVETEADEFVVRCRWRDGIATNTPHIVESVAAHWVAFPEHLAGQPLTPQSVAFPFARPAHAAVHEEFFGCPVTYGGEELIVQWGLEEATTAFQTYDPLVLEKLADTLQHLRDAATDEMTARVVSLLLTADRPARLTAQEAARSLGVSTRTLQRRLSQEQSSYRAILEYALERRAEQWLTIPSLNIDEVVGRLGYGNRSSFHRAFIRWKGVSPAVWRTRQHAGPEGSPEL